MKPAWLTWAALSLLIGSALLTGTALWLGAPASAYAQDASAEAPEEAEEDESQNDEADEVEAEVAEAEVAEAEAAEDEEQDDEASEEVSDQEEEVNEQASEPSAGAAPQEQAPPDEPPEPPSGAIENAPPERAPGKLSDAQRERLTQISQTSSDLIKRTPALWQKKALQRLDTPPPRDPPPAASDRNQLETTKQPKVAEDVEPLEAEESEETADQPAAASRPGAPPPTIIRRATRAKEMDSSWGWLWALAGVAAVLLVPIGLLLARPTRSKG